MKLDQCLIIQHNCVENHTHIKKHCLRRYVMLLSTSIYYIHNSLEALLDIYCWHAANSQSYDMKLSHNFIFNNVIIRLILSCRNLSCNNN